jgi:hypothetical protein
MEFSTQTGTEILGNGPIDKIPLGMLWDIHDPLTTAWLLSCRDCLYLQMVIAQPHLDLEQLHLLNLEKSLPVAILPHATLTLAIHLYSHRKKPGRLVNMLVQRVASSRDLADLSAV